MNDEHTITPNLKSAADGGNFNIPELTHNHHFKFGYDGIPFTYRQRPDQEWYVEYGPCLRPPLNFHDECLETAKIIATKTRDPIHVLFSGGVDSEVTIRSFVEAGIPITAAILRFKNDINIHDISWAIIVCESLSVPYRIYDLDLLKFWQKEALEYAKATYCISPSLLPTMWLVDQIQGYPVFGSGECLLIKDRPEDYVPGVSPYEKSIWRLSEKEQIASWYRHFMVRNRPGCPGFFQYTAEIMLSYLLDPFVVRLVNSEIMGKLTTESSKLTIYQQHFPLAARPKYTGYERVQEEANRLRQDLLSQYPDCNKRVLTPYDELLKMLNPAL